VDAEARAEQRVGSVVHDHRVGVLQHLVYRPAEGLQEQQGLQGVVIRGGGGGGRCLRRHFQHTQAVVVHQAHVADQEAQPHGGLALGNAHHGLGDVAGEGVGGGGAGGTAQGGSDGHAGDAHEGSGAKQAQPEEGDPHSHRGCAQARGLRARSSQASLAGAQASGATGA
jgi:hypothetical protein